MENAHSDVTVDNRIYSVSVNYMQQGFNMNALLIIKLKSLRFIYIKFKLNVENA